ncbi:MAG TPA: hypothetical protein VFZ98_02185, partial [Vicinamibacterales bacterium]
LGGIDRQIELPLPWFMADWLPLHGLLDPRYILPFAALVAVSIALCVVLSRSRALPAVAAAAVAVIWTAAAAGVLAAGAERWCMAGRCEYVQMTSPHIRSTYLYGVRWLDEHVHDVNVAYAGINLPYSLSGSRLSNAVYYVNIDNHRSWRFDQYATAYRNGESAASASGTPPLARPSGVLMPAKDSDAPRPRFERRAGDRDEWEMNLKRQQIGYLFVMTLDPYELDYNWHTAEGFPIEDEWARSDPQAFRLVYSNEDVRIYEVKLM